MPDTELPQADPSAIASTPWADVAHQFQAAFPEADPEYMKTRYEHAQQLASARLEVGNQTLDSSATGFVIRHAIPFVSPIHEASEQANYADARKRLEEGKPRENDYTTIAAFEQQQAVDRQRTGGERLASNLASIPAMVGEYVATGGIGGAVAGGAARALGTSLPARVAGFAAGQAVQAQAMPSLVLPALTQNNREAGRDPLDLRGLPAAMGSAGIENIVLGSLGPLTRTFVPGQGVAQSIARAGLAGPTFVIEQQLADGITGVLNLKTGYGILGQLARGDNVTEELIGQLLTGFVFGAMHEAMAPRTTQRPGEVAVPGERPPEPGEPARPPEPTGPSPEAVKNASGHPVIEAFVEAFNAQKRGGAPFPVAKRKIEAFINDLLTQLRNPLMTKEQIQDWNKGTKIGSLRALGDAMIDYYPRFKEPSRSRSNEPEARDVHDAEVVQPQALPEPGRAGIAAEPLDARLQAVVQRIANAQRSVRASQAEAGFIYPRTPEGNARRQRAQEAFQEASLELSDATQAQERLHQEIDQERQKRPPAAPDSPESAAQLAKPVQTPPNAATGQPEPGESAIARMRRRQMEIPPIEPAPSEPVLQAQGRPKEPPSPAAALGILRRAGEQARSIRERASAIERELAPGAEEPAPVPEPKDWKERVLKYRLNDFRDVVHDAFIRPSPEKVEGLADVVVRLTRMAEGRKLDALIAKELPRLHESFGADTIKELIDIAKEIRHATAADARNLGVSEASLRRLINERLQGQPKDVAPHAPGQGDAQPAQGDAQAAPAPASGDQAGGNQLTSIQQAQLARTSNPWLREVMLRRFAGDGPLADKIKASGGLDAASFPGGVKGPEVKQWKENFGKWIFEKPKSGRKQARWDEWVQEQIGNGAIPPVPADTHPLDHLYNLLASHFTVDADRFLESKQSLEQLAHLEEQARGELARENPAWTEAEIDRRIEEVRRSRSQEGQDQGDQGSAGEINAGATGPEGGALEEGHQPGADVGGFDPAEFDLPPGTQPNNPDRPGDLGPGRIVRGPKRPGQIVLPDVVGDAKQVISKFHDFLGRLSGQMFPATTRANRAAGEALSRLAVAKTYAKEATEFYTDRIMGDAPTFPWQREAWAKKEAEYLLAGAVLTERRLRYMRFAWNQKLADAQAAIQSARTPQELAAARAREAEASIAANAVTSIIGKPGSPLQNLADYRAALKGPMFDQAIRKWNTEFVLLLDETFRTAQGLDPTDPIDNFTQVPGSPMNLKPLQAGEEVTKGTVFTGGEAQGNLRNPRARKLKFARQATGAAEAYDIDIRNIIENSLTHAVPLAAKADMYRTFEKEGLMKWGREGEGLMFDEARGVEIPNVRPPKGTQAEAAGQTSAFFHPDVAGEVREALAVDEVKTYQKVMAKVATIPTIASLASSVEAVTHALNLGGALYAPRMIRNVFSAAYDAWRSSPEFRKEAMELAKIGAMKAPGLESGTIAGPIGFAVKYLTGKELPEAVKYFDPTFYAGKFLDGLSRMVRVTAGRAFDQLAAAGKVKNTQTNKRDFINQLTGQYEKKAQAGIIQWVRNTGIGPFATAGATMTSRAIRTTLAGATGLVPSNLLSGLGMRAEVFAKLAAILGSVAAYNFLQWGRADGDDKTPWGAIKLGQTATGKTIYLDTPASIPRRGLRAIGALAIIEGNRQNRTPGSIRDRAGLDILHSMGHPLLGPGYNALHTTLTGENAVGIHIAPHAPRGQGDQLLLNAGAALGNMNPVVSALVGFDRKPHERSEWYERASKLFGPFGPKFK